MFWNFESRFEGLNLDQIRFCLNHWKVIEKKKLKFQGQIPKEDIKKTQVMPIWNIGNQIVNMTLDH